MGQRKKKIEDPLKLLLPSVIYDYFELVHTEVSDIDVHLFLEEQYMHLPPNVTYEEYQDYFMDVPEGIDEWILCGINHPNSDIVTHDEVSALMEFTAEVLLRRRNEL